MSLFYDIVFAVIYKMHSLSEHISDELSQNSTNCCLYCKFTSSSPDTNRQQKVKHFLPRKRISDLLWASSFWRAMAHQEKKLSFRISTTWKKKKKKTPSESSWGESLTQAFLALKITFENCKEKLVILVQNTQKCSRRLNT